MIIYQRGAYGFQTLFRLHGSAACRALIPSVFSTAIFIVFYHVTDVTDGRLFAHPYPIAALMTAFTFLLTFKASFSYGRYWEAMTAVHQMHSKWLDVGMELAAFHLQSTRYNKPPAFGAHPEVTAIKRERTRVNEQSYQELEEKLDNFIQEQANTAMSHADPLTKAVMALRIRNKLKKKTGTKSATDADTTPAAKTEGDETTPTSPSREGSGMKRTLSRRSIEFRQFERSMSMLTSKQVVHGGMDSKEPPVFLQEGAHLLSLLSAVAMSTLRGDLEEAESPLTEFFPNRPWPAVDPDDYTADIRRDWGSTSRTIQTIRYILGISRNAKSQTMYNAARPFRVVGGVSDAEVEILQAARGAQAKVGLCGFWVYEYISREYLAGSTGGVAPPIISRLYQFLSDGMIGYNQARKIATIPFPFPHTQITSLFVIVLMIFIPLLMLSFAEDEYFGAVLNLLTVMCFAGLHEVARELESPFENVPNDVPLNNFQTQFNEALMTMYTGYHPDAFWEVRKGSVAHFPVKSSEGDASASATTTKTTDATDTAGSNQVTFKTVVTTISSHDPVHDEKIELESVS